MTTILKCSILSILRLEKLLLRPGDQRILSNEVRYLLTKQEFTINPSILPSENSSTNVESEQRILRLNNVKCKRNSSILSWTLLIISVILIGFVIKLSFPYPLHASCLVKWDFGEPCAFVIQKLRSQIIKWSNYKYCDAKCFYKLRDLKAYENNTIRATRIFPKDNSIDDIDIVFVDMPNHSCTALAESSSRGWYKLFDNSRNYCNLNDLIVGAGYDDSRSFLEFTNNLLCTQYDMAYCY